MIVRVHTAIESVMSGAAGLPQVAITVESTGRGPRVHGHLVIEGLPPAMADIVADDLARQCAVGATLALAPLEVADLLRDNMPAAAIHQICSRYDLSLAELSQEASLQPSTIKRVLAGGRLTHRTRRHLASACVRLMQAPTTGQRLRMYRVRGHRSVSNAASLLDIDEGTLSDWEHDRAIVPPRFREPLRKALGLPRVSIWPGDVYPNLPFLRRPHSAA